jgi:hypothetical protein
LPLPVVGSPTVFGNTGDLAVYWSATVSGGTTTDVRYFPAADSRATTQTAWQYVASKTSNYILFSSWP